MPSSRLNVLLLYKWFVRTHPFACCLQIIIIVIEIVKAFTSFVVENVWKRKSSLVCWRFLKWCRSWRYIFRWVAIIFYFFLNFCYMSEENVDSPKSLILSLCICVRRYPLQPQVASGYWQTSMLPLPVSLWRELASCWHNTESLSVTDLSIS